jgi:hypothetical protein
MRQSRAQALARSLGWFSIGLGVAELLAPRVLARASGMEGRERLVCFYGAREIVTGIGLLTAANPAPWLWARVGGDALDIATVATGSGAKAAVALTALAGVTAVDVRAARETQALEDRRSQSFVDYSERSGFPRPPHEMRGAARRASPSLATT